jgi:hypothetical protein
LSNTLLEKLVFTHASNNITVVIIKLILFELQYFDEMRRPRKVWISQNAK